MKINPTDKEKLKSLVNADIENIFAKPNKLGYTYESNAGGFEMKKVKESSTKPPVWFVEFANKQNEFNNKVVEFMARQETFNKEIKQDIAELKRDVAAIKSCPTIQKELRELGY